MTNRYQSLRYAIEVSIESLYNFGIKIKTQKWQGVNTPEQMIELINVDFVAPMYDSVEDCREHCKPNLPWADLHFAERVGGNPTNPGNTFHLWPFWRGGHRDKDEKFTHTYQERLWTDRNTYGNLGDLVKLLNKEPDTRQAFLPIWFPEDTGVRHGGRVPCTIGYHFIIRDGKLHTRYLIRSCDARRHFNDDVYMANRLALWIIDQLDDRVTPGDLTMNIVSFHVFESDTYWLRKYVNQINS